MARFRRSRSRSADTDSSSAAEAPPSAVLRIDGESFMADTAVGWTLVDFWADWCGPCHQFAPVFEEMAHEYEGRVRFGKLDVEAAPQIASMLQIRGVPTLILFDPDGNEASRLVGAVAGAASLVP